MIKIIKNLIQTIFGTKREPVYVPTYTYSQSFMTPQEYAGHQRMARLTPEQRSELARKASNARWDKYYSALQESI